MMRRFLYQRSQKIFRFSNIILQSSWGSVCQSVCTVVERTNLNVCSNAKSSVFLSVRLSVRPPSLSNSSSFHSRHLSLGCRSGRFAASCAGDPWIFASCIYWIAVDMDEKKTSRTEFGQQMRSGKLPAYWSLNRLPNGTLSYS